MPNSEMLVLPMGMTPLPRSRSTETESSDGMKSLKITEPRVIGKPTTGSSSLKANGKPCSGPTLSPRSKQRSASSASLRHSSSSSLPTMPLIFELTRAIWSRNAAMPAYGGDVAGNEEDQADFGVGLQIGIAVK